MFQTKVVKKIKTHILCSITFFRKSCRLWDNVEKYVATARQATDDNRIRRMRFAWWITKATDTYWEYVILIAFHGNNGYTNASECYVTRTLPVLFLLVRVTCSWSMEHWWSDTDRGKPTYLEKTLSQCPFAHHKSHMDWPWIETGPPRCQDGD
jgi:hypothetical protein